MVVLLRQQHIEVGELDVGHLRVLKSSDEFENLVQLKENTDAVYVMLTTLTWQIRSGYIQRLNGFRRDNC